MNRKTNLIKLLVLFLSCNLFAVEKLSSEDIEVLRSNFLTGQEINIKEYESYLDMFLFDDDFTDNISLIYFLDCFNLYSNMQTVNSTEESIKRINDFERSVIHYISKSKNTDVINAYSSYLYSKISWSKDSFAIIEELPYWYKKSMQMDHNKTAELFYSLWLTNAVSSNESNWISYIKQKEVLIEELELKKMDLFNCYLAYSIFYMKIRDTKKGFDYLKKAELLYPNNYECALLEINYKKGRFDW